ncbi:MAG: two-component system sensor histidine kinase NtrB [Phycisphaerales bacterium]
MATAGLQVEAAVAGGGGAGSLAPADFAELLSAFNQVTTRMQSAHERLQREVGGLKRELRDANERLARSKRLAALGEMAAGIAHEVRNPLSSIRLYARMLEQDLTDRPAQRAVATRIAAAVHGLDAVVGDVLNFARELRVSPIAVRAGELFDRAMEACAGETSPSVRVERRGDPDVFGDPGLLVNALVNLVRNAIQSMAEVRRTNGEPGGHVLTLDAHETVGEDGARGVTLRVADTGPGVSPDALDRMFNPFFTTRAAGTGLGLAIVHRIIDAHAGRIAARNRDGGGAVFELFLPSPGDPRGEGAGTEAGARFQESGT